MDAAAEIMELLAEWRRLTEGEHQGILKEDWAEVERHQQAKGRLSAQMTEALKRFRSGPVAGEEEQRINACGSELMVLEMENHELIRSKREHYAAERQCTSETCRHLQGVRRAYGGANPHLWQSYS